MTTSRQQADALFTDADTPQAANAALAAHQRATQAWLAASIAERPLFWRAVESAWRNVKRLGVTEQAQRNAAALTIQHNKLRSTTK